MRRSRWLPAGLAFLVIAAAVGYRVVDQAPPTRPAIAVRYAYLLVSVEAPPAWSERHRPTVVWGGQEVRLPVVFRYRVTGSAGPDWGAAAEHQQALSVMGTQVPVRVEPAAACRVSNEPAVGLIPEPGGRAETVLSVANWVSVGPPERSAVHPDEALGQMFATGSDVGRRIKALVAAGRLIDVGPRP
jgi:hypothetical protein